MSKSKAKKRREKLTREGKRNPEAGRSPFAFADLYTRRTKTKKDLIYGCKHKNRLSHVGKDGSFYLCIFQ
jgi:hypothetical protein